MLARFANIALALWLWVSCYLWPRGATTTLLIGLLMTALIVVFEATSFMDRRIRFGSTLVGVVLIATAYGVPHYWPFLRAHDAALGLAVALLSLVPNREIPGPSEQASGALS